MVLTGFPGFLKHIRDQTGEGGNCNSLCWEGGELVGTLVRMWERADSKDLYSLAYLEDQT